MRAAQHRARLRRYVAGDYEWRLYDGLGHFPHEEAPALVSEDLAALVSDANDAAPAGRPRRVRSRRDPPASPIEPDPGRALPPQETLREASGLLAQGRAFRAHEVFEAIWKATTARNGSCGGRLRSSRWASPTRSGATRAGSATLLRRGAENLAPWEGQHPYGIPVTALRTWAAEAATGRFRWSGCWLPCHRYLGHRCWMTQAAEERSRDICARLLQIASRDRGAAARRSHRRFQTQPHLAAHRFYAGESADGRMVRRPVPTTASPACTIARAVKPTPVRPGGSSRTRQTGPLRRDRTDQSVSAWRPQLLRRRPGEHERHARRDPPGQGG